ncbi:MAG: hypothetical protein H6Q90_1216, partial [Deltaproteobacteria bacterium]|nr:hypothetical protein [Deltaproteobacteria bacterium]
MGLGGERVGLAAGVASAEALSQRGHHLRDSQPVLIA